MPRVLMATEGWGVLQDRFGNARAGLDASFTDLALAAATHWSAETGGTSSTSPVTADSRGRLMRWIEAGEYLMTVEGEVNAVNAVSGIPAATVESPIAAWARLTKPTAALAETIPRGYCNIAQNTLVSGTMRLTPIYLVAGTLCTSITFMSRGTAAVTPTNQWFALYDATRALLRQTVNDTTTAWAANTLKSLALTSTYTTTVTGLYLLGTLVTAATPPNLAGNDAVNVLHGLAPIYNGVADAGLTTTAPNPAAAITASGGTAYAYVS